MCSKVRLSPSLSFSSFRTQRKKQREGRYRERARTLRNKVLIDGPSVEDFFVLSNIIRLVYVYVGVRSGYGDG